MTFSSRLHQWLLASILIVLVPDIACAGPGAQSFVTFFRLHLINQALLAFYGIAGGIIFYMGLKMIFESDKEQSYTDLGNSTLNLFIGFGIIGTAAIFANTLAGFENAPLGFSNNTTSTINTLAFIGPIQSVGTFLRNLAYALFVLMITLSGAQMIANAGDDGKMGTYKKVIIGSCIGVMIMFIATAITTSVSTGDPTAFILELKGITLFVLTFIGFLAAAALIIASIMLIVSIDEGLQGKAKTIIIETLIALIVTIVSYGIIKTFVTEDTFASSWANLPFFV
jgi:hypothetical protein